MSEVTSSNSTLQHYVRSLERVTMLVETLANHVNQTALPCVVGMNNTMRLEKSNVIHIAVLLNFDETITIGKKRKIESETIVKSFCPVHNTDTTLTSLFALHVPVGVGVRPFESMGEICARTLDR